MLDGIRAPRRGLRIAALVTALLASVVTASAATALTTTVYATIDNKVAVSSANANVEQTVYGNTDLGIGCNWQLYYYDGVPYQSFFCARSLVWFDIASLIQDRTIQRAVLRVYPYLLPLSLDTSYSVAPILTTWNGSTVRWSNQPAAGSAVDTLPPPVTTVLPMEFDVTSAVQQWADGTRTNYGFRIRDTNDLVFPYATLDRAVGIESLEYWYATGRRPQLDLEIADVAGPTLEFWADPSRIEPGESSTLRWQTTNATTCYSTTLGWGSPFMSTNGSSIVSPVATKTYGLACSGPGGSISKDVTVTVPEARAGVLAALATLAGLRRRTGTGEVRCRTRAPRIGEA